MTHEERVRAFLVENSLHRADGFVTWYGGTGSYVAEHEQLSGERRPYLYTNGCLLPDGCTFGPRSLAEYFKPGEDLPCFMRGSIYALQVKKYHQQKVFRRQIMRWVRKRKITALTRTEWKGMYYRKFWKAKAERLKDRYGPGGKWSWLDELEHLVDAGPDRPYPRYPCYVLVDGVRYEVEEEQLKALREMQALDRKMRKAA